MQPNEHLKRVMKILIFAFLCTEMQTTFTHRELTKQPGIATSADSKKISPAPYQASIRLIAQDQDYFGKGHICSGALVGPSVVLTLGKCLYNQESKSFYHPAELRVVLGSTQRFAPTAHGQIYGVTHVYQPPKDLSLAILMLEQDVPRDEPRIQPISLPVSPMKTEWNPESWQISSWGLIKHPSHSQELHDMQIVDVERLQCNSQICEAYVYNLKSDVVLDAGAPLTKDNQLHGLKSNSFNFVDVASHVEWIRAETGNGVNQNSSIWGILGLLVFTVYVIKCSSKSLLS